MTDARHRRRRRTGRPAAARLREEHHLETKDGRRRPKYAVRVQVRWPRIGSFHRNRRCSTTNRTRRPEKTPEVQGPEDGAAQPLRQLRERVDVQERKDGVMANKTAKTDESRRHSSAHHHGARDISDWDIGPHEKRATAR